MNRILIGFLVLTVDLASGYGQIGIRNLSSSRPDLFYFNLPNTIEILGLNGISDIQLSSSNSKVIQFAGTNKYYLTPYKLGIDTITVKKNGYNVVIKYYKIQLLDSFYCFIGKHRRNHLTPKEITINPVLNLCSPKSMYRPIFKISSFKLKVLHQGVSNLLYEQIPKGTMDTSVVINPVSGEEKWIISERTEKDLHNIGNKLSRYQQYMINRLQRGDLLIFTNIKISCNDSDEIEIGDYNILIK